MLELNMLVSRNLFDGKLSVSSKSNSLKSLLEKRFYVNILHLYLRNKSPIYDNRVLSL